MSELHQAFSCSQAISESVNFIPTPDTNPTGTNPTGRNPADSGGCATT